MTEDALLAAWVVAREAVDLGALAAAARRAPQRREARHLRGAQGGANWA